MAQPARKMPRPGEPETVLPSVDPFRYGSRWRRVRLPSGEVTEQEIPLTAEDLLDPELGDEVTQSDPHFEFLLLLARLLRGHYRSQGDVLVAGDMKMFWGIPGLKEPSPDIAIIPGVRRKYDPDRGSFDAAKEGVLPCLIIEIVSATDSEVRRNDYEKKVVIYQQVGIPEYLILDPPTSATKGRLLWTGYRLGSDRRYRRIAKDRGGLLLSETTGLRFGTEKDGETLLIVDAKTGERLLDPDDQAIREAEARRAAEERAHLEAQAKRAAEERAREAEAEVARLRAELERFKKSAG
jgi:colicin import membrane protein